MYRGQSDRTPKDDPETWPLDPGLSWTDCHSRYTTTVKGSGEDRAANPRGVVTGGTTSGIETRHKFQQDAQVLCSLTPPTPPPPSPAPSLLHAHSHPFWNFKKRRKKKTGLESPKGGHFVDQPCQGHHRKTNTARGTHAFSVLCNTNRQTCLFQTQL